MSAPACQAPELRPASTLDAAVLAAIQHAAVPPAERWPEASLGTQLALPGTFGLLHPDGGFVLARVVCDEAEVLLIAVVPAARRRGVARALLSGVMTAAARRGASAMFLEAGNGNAAALALYRGMGFMQVGRRAGYYPGGEAALVLRAELSPCAAPVP